MPRVEVSNYGSFAGPGSGDGNSNPALEFNDNEDNDPIQEDDSDFAFINETNIACCLAADSSNYARFRCNGTSVSDVTIDNNSGALSTLTLNSAATTVSGTLEATGTITAPTFSGTINQQAWKGFDIKHPNKDNHRLRHICAEGPEAGVYIRGKLKGSNTIKLPDYWNGLIDPSTITVTLTQIGYSQDLIVESEDPEWGRQIKIRSGSGVSIHCFYEVWAARIDGDPLIVEYEGATPADYPGDDKQFSISGYDYDARGEKSTKDIKL